MKERDHLEDLGVDVGKYYNESSRSEIGSWTGLFWRAFVNSIMNFRVP
jgi:hypothetical protein